MLSLLYEVQVTNRVGDPRKEDWENVTPVRVRMLILLPILVRIDFRVRVQVRILFNVYEIEVRISKSIISDSVYIFLLLICEHIFFMWKRSVTVGRYSSGRRAIG